MIFCQSCTGSVYHCCMCKAVYIINQEQVNCIKAESQSIISNHLIMLDNIFRNCICYDGDEGKLAQSPACAFRGLIR